MNKLTVGQKLWSVQNDRGRIGEPKEVEVAKVGNKYFYLVNDYRKYDIEKMTDVSKYSSSANLFLSLQEILDLREQDKLGSQLRELVGKWGRTQIPLEKLRRIIQIIEE